MNPLTKRIISALDKGDKLGMNMLLRIYKHETGTVNYIEVMKIPVADRLYGLAKRDFERTHKIVGAAITLALESLNLKQSLTATQIIDLVDVILESSLEDNLAFEDVLLFLQKLVRGEAGKLFNSIDIPTFMKMFEDYRQERYKELIKYRENKHEDYKDLGRGSLPNKSLKADEDAGIILDLMQTYNESRSDDTE